MANEITASASLVAAKSGVNISFTATKQNDMTGADMLQATQAIGTTSETLGFGAITGAPAMVLVKNLDGTNFVELGLDSAMTNKFAKLLPGQVCLFPPSTATIYAKADTAEVTVLIAAVEA